MARLGMEGYIGRSKKTVFEFSYGFGLTQNWVRKRGDLDVAPRRWFLDEISVSNRNSGFLPYVDFRIAFGRRLNKED